MHQMWWENNIYNFRRLYNKHLEPAISLANKYDLPPYLKQSLELTKRRVEGIFGKEKEKQIALGQWFA